MNTRLHLCLLPGCRYDVTSHLELYDFAFPSVVAYCLEM